MQIEIEDEWTDDHLPCVRVKIVEDRGVRVFELWCTSTKTIAALRFADESPRALKKVEDLINTVFNFENEEKDEEGGDYICTDHGALNMVNNS